MPTWGDYAMRLHFATVPMYDADDAEEALNRFLASHRVVAIERQFVSDGQRSAWAVCVSWVDGKARTTASEASVGNSGEGRLDYREILSAEQFAVYARLRDLRKKLSEREGVPAYAVVTNEQMAEMTRRPITSLADLAKLEGIGPARTEKYGAALLEALRAPTAEPAAAKPAVAKPQG